MSKPIEDIAAEIDEYVNQSTALETIAKEYNMPFDASPLYNFRDALSHYIKLYESTPDSDIYIAQASSIEEHLFRGLKDIILYITITMKARIIKYKAKYIDIRRLDDQNKFRALIHSYKEIELMMRSNSEVFLIRDLVQFIDGLAGILKSTKNLFSEYDVKAYLNR
jgi:hypothetical protein